MNHSMMNLIGTAAEACGWTLLAYSEEIQTLEGPHGEVHHATFNDPSDVHFHYRHFNAIAPMHRPNITLHAPNADGSITWTTQRGLKRDGYGIEPDVGRAIQSACSACAWPSSRQVEFFRDFHGTAPPVNS